MKQFFHLLKANKTNSFPRNWIYLDVEARFVNRPDGKTEHHPRLGCALYQRDGRKNNPARSEWLTFLSPLTFWPWLLEKCEGDRRVVLVGYNVGYDFRLVGGFEMAAHFGFKQSSIYSSGRVTILKFRRDKLRLDVIDCCNYFDGKLSDWADLMGTKKLGEGWRSKDWLHVEKYCRRDVEVLAKLMKSWREFNVENDLGSFSPTRAGQSLNAFRHRFMDNEIYIHANEPAVELERKTCRGGRTEAFFLGRLPSGPYFKLDYNSMYPSIMATQPVPIKLRKYCKNVEPKRIIPLLDEYALCAECVVETDEPIYAITRDGYLIFPTGRFTCWLATPEIKEAMKRGHLKHINQLTIYDQAVIFERFVKHFYQLRQRYKRDKNPIFALMVKTIMNSLYGKFSQASEKWEPVNLEIDHHDGSFLEYHGPSNTRSRYVVIANQSWRIAEREPSMHTFFAISSHITASARMLLWSAMKQAGHGNYFYCDTDSLIVNQDGYDKLASMISPTKLGMLAMEERTNTLEIQSAKAYMTDYSHKSKGVGKSLRGQGNMAEAFTPKHFRYAQWQGLRGAIAAGDTTRVIVSEVDKHLTFDYKKGVRQPSGSVSPIMLREA